MAIATLDQYIAAAKQRVALHKTAIRATVPTIPFSTFDLAGNPGAGTLAGSSTAAGVVPDDTTAGCPSINAFGVSATGYLSKVEFANSVASRLTIFDMLFKAGAYSFAAGTTTLSAQPSYSSRVPNSDYTGLEIWIEVSTAFVSGSAWQVQVTYTNQAGTTGRTSIISAAQAAAALALGKMFQIALQAGDTGVQKIESVIVTNGGTAMSAGAFNVLVLRRLWSGGQVRVANGGDVHDMLKTGMPVVYDTSALILQVTSDSTSSGVPEVVVEVCNG